MLNDASDDDIDDLVELGQSVISSIFNRQPLSYIKSIIEDNGAPLWYQDEDGTSALHAAAFVEDESLIAYLIENGAVWNAVDNLHNSAADVALSLNNETCYRIIRDAGIRSEMLLALLSTRSETPASFLLKAEDNTARASTDAFLASRLRFTHDEGGQEICLLDPGDGPEVGVMMGWERGLMKETVHRLCHDHKHSSQGLKVLNIGFGLGIIDDIFQSLSPPPSLHVIIEAHPDVQSHMRERGWLYKPGVKILDGKWQDLINDPVLIEADGFDVIYTDTFSEDYQELRRFFDHVPRLLHGPDSRFSFFNGLGATNASFYDVYSHISELHLAEIGLDVSWHQVDVIEHADENRWGNTLEYFAMRVYNLPIAKMSVQ